MSATIQNLSDFLAAAEKSRIYPANTVYGIKAALKLFSEDLTDEEKESYDTFKAHFEQIYQSVFNKNKSKMTAGTLGTYRRRMMGFISDYEKYGVDPTKMSSWARPTIKRQIKIKVEPGGRKDKETTETEGNIVPDPGVSMHRVELSLRPGRKAIILVPFDLTTNEAEKIKGLVGYLVVDK